ncbi:DEAD-domain-containing protein [Stereum hirsutum FP-91666 SS1]|uniref:DEAD-domain-containing protein n=1 Tax=Stereum hirsutum (strain FP-91666) TaxID=721885 RepID=UPI0004449361|nr:DEAD-domain-containing protein [Stereum hirsutum FP-91666 SS1]EIM81977.1 DEAD-domain-containing protein [Stereum hirsutum FP-91666 SS1]
MSSSLWSTASRTCCRSLLSATHGSSLITRLPKQNVAPLDPTFNSVRFASYAARRAPVHRAWEGGRGRGDSRGGRSSRNELQDGDEPAPLQADETAAEGGTAHDSPDATYDAQPDFSTLKGKISDRTLKAITVKPMELKHMSPVQAAVLPLLPELARGYDPAEYRDGQLSGPPRDLLVKAKTGTGKTLGFLVPAIEARLKAIDKAGQRALAAEGVTSNPAVENRAKRVFAMNSVGTLIISPTRELATQIANEAIRLSHWHDDFEVRLFTGGTSKRNQLRDFIRGRRDVVVATPGRLRDLLESEPEVRRAMKETQTLILDEADTLLEMGFRDEIDAIKEFLPPTPERQTFLFSATLSTSIRQVARSTLDKSHTFIDVVPKDDSPVHSHIPQFHTVLPSAADQIPHILRLIAHDQLSNPGKSKLIVFLPTTKMTQLFATLLRQLSHSVPAGKQTRVYEIHSKRTQESRSKVSDMFRKDQSGATILVSSDISARGVDYPGVTRVIQVGIPGGTEQYIHRVGRTGRAGTSGRGDLVLLPWEIGFISWQLTEFPIKALHTNELKSEVAELSSKHDADPDAFWKDPTGRPVRRLNRFAPNTAARLEEIPNHIEALFQQLEEDAIKETVASLLGYYIAKQSELRVQKGVMIEGIKAWSVEACGLPQPPYFSPDFLDRLGFSDNRTKHFGKGPKQQRFNAPPSNHWQGRGSVRGKEQRERGSGYRGYDNDRRGGNDREGNDTRSGADEHRGRLYDRRTASQTARGATGNQRGGGWSVRQEGE